MDKVLEKALKEEKKRQQNNIELIASENYVSKDILKLQGSILTNKYAEGYPYKRYYGGCEHVDTIESRAISLACEIFDCKYANVQPHSGSSANMAVYRSLLEKGDKIVGMDLSNGGHLTHGHKMSFSGQDYNIVSYSVDNLTEEIDYNALEELVLKEKPKMVIAGASAYSRIIDFKKFREICDKVNAYLMVDMAHIAGLVATNQHPSPFPHAHVVTSTTHKTLRGPRGGLILTNEEEIIKKINKTIFPGIQGGPLMHVIAAKAQCFYEAKEETFKDYCIAVIRNAKILSNTLMLEGFKIISGGTDTHLMLINVKEGAGITGKEAEEILDSIHITVNKNTIPNDTESPMVTSGIRIGTPAMTTRGFTEHEFEIVGKIIGKALKNHKDEKILKELSENVLDLTKKFPL